MGFFGSNFEASPAFTAMVFPYRGAVPLYSLVCCFACVAVSMAVSIKPRTRTTQCYQCCFQRCLQISIFIRFRCDIREFFGYNFEGSPSFTAMVFPYPGAMLLYTFAMQPAATSQQPAASSQQPPGSSQQPAAQGSLSWFFSAISCYVCLAVLPAMFSCFHCFSKVSEDALGSFLVAFLGASVLHCHGA